MTGAEPAIDEHEAIEADLADYVAGTLSEARVRQIDSHLEGCERCQQSLQDEQGLISGLSGLSSHPAPQDFEKGVTETIRRRSRGRFFGRKAFGDRVPFELLAVLVLAMGLVLVSLIRCSDTGSLRYDRGESTPTVPPEAREVIPRP